MAEMIGIDPHKASHTALAIDNENEHLLGRLRGGRVRTRSSGGWRGGAVYRARRAARY